MLISTWLLQNHKNVNLKSKEICRAGGIGERGGGRMKKIEDAILHLAEECLCLGQQERYEIRWLKAVYDRFRAAAGNLGKTEADQLIYAKMYGMSPEKTSDTLKIRYWRTGHHLPANREQCVSFGKALELTEQEQLYLIQAYYDRSDCVFEAEQMSELYLNRKELMKELTGEYLDKVHPVMKLQFYHAGRNLEHSLRHEPGHGKAVMPGSMTAGKYVYSGQFSLMLFSVFQKPRNKPQKPITVPIMPATFTSISRTTKAMHKRTSTMRKIFPKY